MFKKILLFIIAIIAPIAMVVTEIQFNQNCKGFLKQTADANSVELAIDRLNIAIKYVEDNNLTSGYTSVLYKTENENIGFWYKNLLTCREELTQCINSSQFEQTNVLMKVRESLTDDGEHGTEITVPLGIARYPNNKAWGCFIFFSICCFIGIVFVGNK
jgi:hypothetical protein